MTGFAAALKDPAAPPLAAAEFLLTRGYDKASARDFLTRQPGFLGRRLGLDQARELAAAAGTAGLPALVCSEEEIPAPPAPLKPHKVIMKPAGFDLSAGTALTFVHFESVSLFAAGAYDAAVPPPGIPEMKSGIFAKIAELAGLQDAPPRPQFRDTFFRADLLTSDGLHAQLRPEDLDFSGLGAARAPSSLTNFRTLLDAMSGPCLNAAKNAFLAAFTTSSPLAPLKLANSAACDTELSRLLLACGARRRV